MCVRHLDTFGMWIHMPVNIHSEATECPILSILAQFFEPESLIFLGVRQAASNPLPSCL